MKHVPTGQERLRSRLRAIRDYRKALKACTNETEKKALRIVRRMKRRQKQEKA